MDIANFFSIYPDKHDEHLQEILAMKREFIQYRGQKDETINPLKHFFNHQRLVGQLMFVVDRCLLIHKTGTGKTCSLETIAETLIAFMARWGFEFRRTYVVIDKSLQDNLIRELACVCNREKYLSDEINQPSNFSVKMRRLRKKIKNFFIFRSRLKFASEIKNLDDESLKVHFKNTLVFIDEAHLLLTLQTGQDTESKSSRSLGTQEEQRKEIERLFRTVSDMKVVLSTATPAINSPVDALNLANLILPSDRLIDTKTIGLLYEEATSQKKKMYEGLESVDFTIPIEELNKLKGYVSFVEALKNTITVNFVGVEFEKIYSLYRPNDIQIPLSYKNKVFPIPLTEIQLEALRRIKPEGITMTSGVSLSPDESFAELFTFPDYGFKKESFERWLSGHRNHHMLVGDELKKYSMRYYHFVYSNMSQPHKKSFTYIPFIIGSGIDTLREVLLANGYDEYLGEPFMEGGTSSAGSICSTDVENKISAKFQQKPRFAVMTGNNSTMHGMIISLYNHFQNWNGVYLQILIGSDVARFSYSFLDVSNIYIMLPQWNRANIYQALSRGIRTNSHRLTLKNLRLETYTVNIYQYCSY